MKKIVVSLLIVFLCGIAYAQDSVIVYRGVSMQKILLSDIDSITHSSDNYVIIHYNNQKYECYITKIDSISIMNRMPVATENNPITIVANIDDPEIFMFQVDDSNLVHYYGLKNEEGFPLSICMIVVENEKEGNTKIIVDNKMRPLQVYTPVGVVYDFEWNDDYSGVITACDTSTGTTIKVSFDRTLEDGVSTINPQSYCNGQYQSGNRIGELKIESNPIILSSMSLKSPIQRSAENGHQECLVTFTKCDGYFDPWDVYLSISNKDEWVGNLYDYYKVGTGKYLFTIPSDSYPSIDIDKWAEWINNIIGTIGNISSYLTASGGDFYVCGAIATGLTLLSDGAFAECAAQFTAGCVAFNRAIATANQINTGGTDAGASIIGNLIEYLKNANVLKRVYTGNIRISPVINGSWDPNLDEIMTPEENSITIALETEGTPSVERFYCNPQEPVAGQDYDATIVLHCMPSGTKVTMSIKGTDNYSKSETTTLTSPNSTVTLHVPGAAEGVHDYIEARIYDANGDLLDVEYASLYFH